MKSGKIKINKKLIILLVVVLLLIVPLTAYAQAATTAASSSDSLTTFFTKLTEFLATTLLLLQKLLWPILLVIGGLLNNDLLFGAGMEDRLLSIWTQIRDMVNIIIVVILLAVAILNVLGVESDKISIKEFLKNLVLALIAVNFSFIAMKIILDVTAVGTTAIFALPASIGQKLEYTGLVPEYDASKPLTETDKTSIIANMTEDQRKKMESVCRNIFGSKPEEFEKRKASALATFEKEKQEMQSKGQDVSKLPPPTYKCEVFNNKYQYSKEGIDYFSRFHSRNAAMIMAIQMMNISQLDEVSEYIKTDAATGKVSFDLKTLMFNMLFSVILYIVYATAYIALFTVLITRLIVLWLLIALSPIIGVQIVLPNLLSSAGGSLDLKGKFLKNTFAPVMIAIPLTIGYMMLDAYKKADVTGAGSATEVLKGATSAMSLDTTGIGDLQQLIMALATVAVVWIGVFAIATETQAGFLTDIIRDRVKGAGRRIAGLIQYAPIVPTPKGKMSMNQILGKTGEPIRKIEEAGRYDRGVTGLNPFEGTATEWRKMREALSKNYGLIETSPTQKHFGDVMIRMNNDVRSKLFGTDQLKALGMEGKTFEQVREKFERGGFTATQIRDWLRTLHQYNVRPAPETGKLGATDVKDAQANAQNKFGISTNELTADLKLNQPQQIHAFGRDSESQLSSIQRNGSSFNTNPTDANTKSLLTSALNAYSQHLQQGPNKLNAAQAKKTIQTILKKLIPDGGNLGRIDLNDIANITIR